MSGVRLHVSGSFTKHPFIQDFFFVLHTTTLPHGQTPCDELCYYSRVFATQMWELMNVNSVKPLSPRDGCFSCLFYLDFFPFTFTARNFPLFSFAFSFPSFMNRKGFQHYHELELSVISRLNHSTRQYFNLCRFVSFIQAEILHKRANTCFLKKITNAAYFKTASNLH